MRGSVQEGTERVKSSVHVDRETVKSGLEKTRRAIPLKRSRTDRIFLGVCGGIGKALGMDANLVRLIWAAFSIGSLGTGVLVYVLVGLLLPEEEPAPITGYVDQEPQEVQIIDGSLG
ncbi:MAG: PspC domain-containing protein [Caldilineae bacterium]|nr:MAG: PspC domain-containing protein [Caldilineae bacterium]